MKKYILKTKFEEDNLIAYVIGECKNLSKIPYCTSSIKDCKKFKNKKDALKMAKYFGDCFVKPIWE